MQASAHSGRKNDFDVRVQSVVGSAATFAAATPVEFAGFGAGVLGIAAKGSIVIQAMLSRLAQEELALQEVHCTRVKATGSVEAAKPLQQKRSRTEGVIRQQRPSYRFCSTFPATELSLRRAGRLRCWAAVKEQQRYALGEGDVALFVLMVAALVVAQTWLDWRDTKKDWVVPEWVKGLALAGLRGRIAHRSHFVRIFLARGSGQRFE